MFLIQRLTAPHIKLFMPQLVKLLLDNAAHGVSIGFCAHMSEEECRVFWESVAIQIRLKTHTLLVARQGDDIVGALQLCVENFPTLAHRAEIRHFMIHSEQRRQGIGRILLRTAEDEARHVKRSLLTAITRKSDPAEILFSGMGFMRYGEIPQYIQAENEVYHAVSCFYKLLK
jgi:acetyltransferase